jgi:HEAT repeat protein
LAYPSKRDPTTFSHGCDRIQDLINRLASGDANVRADAVRQLLHGGTASVVAFCGLFCDGPATPLSNRATEVLKKLGRDAVEPLVRVLKTGSPEAQVYAIVGLQMLGEPSAWQPLLEALESPYAKVRRGAIDSLWMLRDQKAVEPLIRHLQHDNDFEVTVAAASALGWIGDRRAVDSLLSALENRHWRMRQAAAYALGSIGDEQTLDAIRRHLFDPKPQVRRAVKGALSQFHWRRLHPPE